MGVHGQVGLSLCFRHLDLLDFDFVLDSQLVNHNHRTRRAGKQRMVENGLARAILRVVVVGASDLVHLVSLVVAMRIATVGFLVTLRMLRVRFTLRGHCFAVHSRSKIRGPETHGVAGQRSSNQAL